MAREGEAIYRLTCAGCHGPRGAGLVNFGRPLTTSSFVAGLDDRGLHVELANSALFDSGSAELSAAGQRLLRPLDRDGAGKGWSRAHR